MNEAVVIYLGKFNIRVNDVESNDAQNFLRKLKYFSIFNSINKPKYNSGHTLDLVNTNNITPLWKI